MEEGDEETIEVFRERFAKGEREHNRRGKIPMIHTTWVVEERGDLLLGFRDIECVRNRSRVRVPQEDKKTSRQ